MTKISLGKIAGSAAIIKDQKILLLQRSNNASTFPGYWTFPSGGVEEYDQTIQHTVIREVKEETGLSFIPKKKFNFYESTANGKRYFALIFLGEWSGKITLQKEEISQYRFCSYQEAKKMNLAFAYSDVINDLYIANIIT